MKFINNSEPRPIFSWCDPIEDGAWKQAKDLANHRVAFHHIALMPDCHQGYGMPIGGVMACDHAIIPNAVGVDIGCGMVAVSTSMQVSDFYPDQIKEVMGIIRKDVPVGFKHQDHAQSWDGFDRYPDSPVIKDQIQRAKKQLGTLGGGNHFIEFQRSEDGYVWIMVHSGSRNFGLRIAKYYNDKAIELCERWRVPIPNKDLAFLPIGEPLAAEYIEAMNYALDFAKENRHRIMLAAALAFVQVTGEETGDPINIHHNYARLENHFGRNVWIHRKGATSARAGELGIIPGSMGTPSYIVEGLGNPESFMSCSHGAGRCMGRKAASRNLTVEECDTAMDGIVYGRWGKDRKGRIDLGEAPQAYKDIDIVIAAQLDLIKPMVKLHPLGVIKG